jgi:hypothetical protein
MGRLNRRGSRDDGELPAGWSQPEGDSSGSGWRAPGQHGPLGDTHGTGNAAYPFECCVCGEHMRIEGAYVKSGSPYCFACRPAGTTSSADLPSDVQPRENKRPDWAWLAWILELLMFFFD